MHPFLPVTSCYRSTPKNLCVHPWNTTDPRFWELRWHNHISLAELKESTAYFPLLRLQGTFRVGFLISQTFRGLAWRTRGPSPWNSTRRITSGSRLSQAELHSNWRMEKRCQRPSCLLPPPTVSSLSGKCLVNRVAPFQLSSRCPFSCPSCPKLPPPRHQSWAQAGQSWPHNPSGGRLGWRDSSVEEDCPFWAFVALRVTHQDSDKEGGGMAILPSDGIKLA